MGKLKKISKKLNVQLLAETFKAFGIRHIVLSPGSRNGALATHFSHDPAFETYTIVDERSAGFVALGMAQQLREPVVVCSTSGSAVVNYFPAVTEVFYQNIPLIVLSADRPVHLVDNFDGQTIRQQNVLASHSYDSVQLSECEDTETLIENLELIKKALLGCRDNSGPVHINIPFSEPLYEFGEEKDIVFEKLEIPEKAQPEIKTEEFLSQWNASSRKLVLVGMQYPAEELNRLMNRLADDDSVVVLTETTSNLHGKRFFNKIDTVIFSLSEEALERLKPEILLTVGQNVVSKKIKAFFRNHPPKEHWHLDAHWHPDTFGCLTEEIHSAPLPFLREFTKGIKSVTSDYYEKWNTIREEKEKLQKEFSAEVGFSDYKVFEKLIASYPEGMEVQYSNSSVIRYAQLFKHTAANPVFCNRGTSGIDGSTSTAAGASVVRKGQTLLVSGDIAFFYDSNGLWNPYLPADFRIILINNGGGNIFRIIPGPENTGVLEKVFEAQHRLTAEHLAKMYDFEYYHAENEVELDETLKEFYKLSERPRILEINTIEQDNAIIQRAFFDYIRK